MQTLKKNEDIHIGWQRKSPRYVKRKYQILKQYVHSDPMCRTMGKMDIYNIDIFIWADKIPRNQTQNEFPNLWNESFNLIWPLPSK